MGFIETKNLASGKSKGALLVSAIAEIINKKIKGNKGKKLEIIDWLIKKSIKLIEPLIKTNIKIIKVKLIE